MLLWTVNSVDKRLAASKVTSTERHWLSLAVVFLFLAEQPEWNSPSALCGCLKLCLLRAHTNTFDATTHSLLRLMDTFVTTFLGRSQASRGKRQIITRLYSVWAVAFLTFHKGWFFFFEDTWKCKQESALLTPPHPTPRTRPCSPLQLPKCLEGHTASSAYDKGPDSGVTSICPFQRTSEKETGGSGDGDGCLLMAGVIYQASARLSPDKHSWNWCQWSWNQSGLRWSPPPGVSATPNVHSDSRQQRQEAISYSMFKKNNKKLYKSCWFEHWFYFQK